ncbi:MAG: hypothetical protein OXE85_15090 [Roseovarius sp.]|nr:hypothetical protein [Roseovarius sp.]
MWETETCARIALFWDCDKVPGLAALDSLVHEKLSGFTNGAISAEYGVGLEKRKHLHQFRGSRLVWPCVD